MIALLLMAVLVADPAADASSPSPDKLRFFETQVRPLLVEHCHKCHGPNEQWAGLRLDSGQGILQGGDSGPTIVPGNPDESLLILAVSHEDENLKMPAEGKLSDQQIATLVRWVEMGAPFPADKAPTARSRDPNHWAFQPPADPPLPAVNDISWAQSPIDRFILAKLESAGLSPAPPADKRTLIRRLTFDLTGLPPTPAEIEAFVADDRPEAYARLVERLLDSTAYGERWGRHWLDVARYSDSNGLDENVAHGNAWRYRDYVVAAFNRDKPFDRFLVEQLAGDLLPAADEAQRHEQLIATGFLAIGPKVLAEPDEAKMQMDIIDEQIDTTGRAFLGLTLGCARCHDHKFDPIATADYYGLAGIFKSSRVMEHYKKVAVWHENVLPSPAATAMHAEYDARIAAKAKEIDGLVAEADAQLRESLAAGASLPEKMETLYPDATKAKLKTLRADLTKLKKSPPDVPSAMGATEDTVADAAIHVRGNPLKLGDIVPRHTPPAIRGPQPPQFTSSQSGRRELADWLTDPQHPLTARVMVNRIWRWHFGRGLVSTTDNFGLLGQPPSHPELLDWLACRFMADGWSLKSLHRLIVSSSTYQQSSMASADSLASDPENRLFCRANVRRLEAEAVRDAMLAVSGQLDGTVGGSLLAVENRGYFFNHTSKDLTSYVSRRRSLYLPVVRNNVFDLFQLLDFPDPAVSSSDRVPTTVAPQALMMLNSDFVMDQAAEFARVLLAEPSDDDQRLRRLYLIAYAREPSPEECRANEDFLDEIDQSLAAQAPGAIERRQGAWSVLCHTILAANEFIYVK